MGGYLSLSNLAGVQSHSVLAYIYMSMSVILFTVHLTTNCSPSSLTYEDTYNTLKYADRAKQIKTPVYTCM